MTWSFSWDSTTVTFPVDPSKVTVKYTSQITNVTKPGDLPILLSLGNQQMVLEVEGILAQSNKTTEQLYNEYIAPLAGRVHRAVTLDAEGSRYDGSYILYSITWEERGGAVNAIWYKLELWKGSLHVVV